MLCGWPNRCCTAMDAITYLRDRLDGDPRISHLFLIHFAIKLDIAGVD